MTTHATSPAFEPAPLALVGRFALNVAGYLGGVASVTARACRRDTMAVADDDTVTAQLAWIFGLGLPFVALMHVGIGSFLAMQSYFGGTFADGTGAVVGVGLLRNMASLLSGLCLAGLVAARMTPELRARSRASRLAAREGDDDAQGFLSRTASGQAARRGPVDHPEDGVGGRALAARLIATTIAGPVFGVWGAAVGTLVGWQVAQTIMGVSTHNFFRMFWEMLWVRDLAGMLVKGVCAGFLAGAFSCYEGLRGDGGPDVSAVSSAAGRAACFAGVGMLIVSSGWFILLYHAGPAFGPTLLQPPVL